MLAAVRTLSDAIRLVRKSDLATAPLGTVSERIAGAFVDSVRENPGYWHGNRIVLDAPPAPREVEAWRERHRELFAWRGEGYPAVITWYDQLDVPAPEIADEVQTALLAPSAFVEAPQPRGLRAVDVATEALWDAVAGFESAIYPHYGEFTRWRLETLRALVERRRGTYRALVDESGAVVAALGAFYADGTGRFANVATAPAYRRRGCASHLITTVLTHVRRRVDDVAIVADAGSDAERLYRSLGFLPLLSIRSIQR